MATDQLRKTTADALQQLLIARVAAERQPMPAPSAEVLSSVYREVRLERVREHERARLIADLDEAIEHTSRALARARNAPVIPLPLPHVARAEAA